MDFPELGEFGHVQWTCSGGERDERVEIDFNKWRRPLRRGRRKRSRQFMPMDNEYSCFYKEKLVRLKALERIVILNICHQSVVMTVN